LNDRQQCDDAELADWLRRFLGYSLTASTVEQLFVFAFGHGANGKSVLTEAIQSLMGDYSASIQPATLCDDKRTGAGPSPDLARLNGVRFAVAPEAEEGSRFAESMLKALVGGDSIPVRELNCAPFDMRPVLKLALTGNHKPHISGTDRGIWRRVRLVPFAASFEGKADPHLSHKLRGEVPHILAWLVAGCLDWQRRGLSDTPRAIANATEAYRQESDTLGQWLEERCTRGPNAREQSADLYTDFRWWCHANGFSKVPTSLSFLKRLTEYRVNGWDVGAEKFAGKRYRTGIALRESTPINVNTHH
jgi:P4 family phage/plasmid primase-like protien